MKKYKIEKDPQDPKKFIAVEEAVLDKELIFNYDDIVEKIKIHEEKLAFLKEIKKAYDDARKGVEEGIK